MSDSDAVRAAKVGGGGLIVDFVRLDVLINRNTEFNVHLGRFSIDLGTRLRVDSPHPYHRSRCYVNSSGRWHSNAKNLAV